MTLGEAFYVQLVDDRVAPRGARRAVLAPGEGVIDHLAAAALDHPGVGIEQDLVVVEAVTALEVVSAVNPIAVDQAGPGLGQVAVPDVVGALADLNALDLAPSARIEQAKLDALGVLRKQREVDPRAVPGRAQGIGAAAPDGAGRDQGSDRRFHSAWIMQKYFGSAGPDDNRWCASCRPFAAAWRSTQPRRRRCGR